MKALETVVFEYPQAFAISRIVELKSYSLLSFLEMGTFPFCFILYRDRKFVKKNFYRAMPDNLLDS
jgi:hypothetical protein